MDNQFWNYIITAVGLAGFFLAGKKVWWCWYVNIANQILWFVYGWATEQWGFVVGTFFYSYVFVRNAYLWTQEHLEEKQYQKSHPPEQFSAMSIGFKLDTTAWEEGMRKAGQQVKLLSAAFAKTSPYLPKGRWCPWWFHKRFHKKKPVKVTDGIGGPKVGWISETKSTGEGLEVTGQIDTSTDAGKEAWEKIKGPPGKYSIPEQD